MPKLKARNVVACEEIRRLDSGRHILLGVLITRLRVSQLPADIALSMWIEVVADTQDEILGEFRIIAENDAVLLASPIEVAATKIARRPASLTLPKMPIQLQRTGIIRAQWRFPPDDWETLKEIEVAIGQPTKEKDTLGAAPTD